MAAPSEDAARQASDPLSLALLGVLAVQVARVLLRQIQVEAVDYGPDGEWYVAMADMLAKVGVMDPRAFSAGYMHPLWPMVIRLLWIFTGRSFGALRAANLLFWGCTLGLTYLLARPLLGKRGALLATCLLSFDGLWNYVELPQYEVFLAMAMAAALLAWVRAGSARGRGPWAFSGVMWGLAGLVQARVLLIPALLVAAAPAAEGKARCYRGPMLAALVALYVMLPYGWRNWVVLGHFSLVPSNSGENLFIGNNPAANGSYLGIPWELRPAGHNCPDLYVGSAAYRQAACKWIWENPRQFALVLAPRKLANFWDLGKPVNAAFVGLMLAGAAMLWRWQRSPAVEALVVIVFYFCALHLIFFAVPRFRLPILPMAHILAAGAVVLYLNTRRSI
ncbi:MAG: glycosyltransferase family 39 protein [Candidatus Wallbacteria bacterium]|nr:glycosyltransferase family 39 protein [Candidatus Wallbacteria bacterium]